MSRSALPLLLFLPVVVLPAQIQPTIPPVRSQALLCADPDWHGIWRMIDWNQDGDYHDVGEIQSFYDGASGGIALPAVDDLKQLRDGTVLVVDPGVFDRIVALRDLNGDGDAKDAGEQWVWFDSHQLSGVGVLLNAMCGLVIDQQDRAFVCNAGTNNGDKDAVYRMQDLNGDGDVMDLGEFGEYCEISPWTAPMFQSAPGYLLAAEDGNLYCTDNGFGQPRGVYRLADINQDGDCNDVGERALYWAPPAGGGFASLRALAVDQDLRFYVGSAGDHRIWTGFDANGDQMIDASEQGIFHSAAESAWSDIAVDESGRLFVCEGIFPNAVRILVLDDVDGSGVIDAGEAADWFNRQVSATPAPRPMRATFERAPSLAQPVAATLGQAVVLSCRTAKSADLCALFLSQGLAPTPFDLVPWGVVEIDLAGLSPVGFGLADAEARFDLVLPIPNSPAVIGAYGLQAIGGDGYRLFLSNGALLTVTP